MHRAAFVLVAVAACAPPPERGVVDALAAYRQSVLAMNADASVALMEPDVAVSHGDQPGLAGRDAVSKMLHGFAGYTMRAYVIDADSTVVTGDTAHQHGRWSQDGAAPDGTPFHVTGTFDADWHRDADGAWRIAKMHTAN